MSSDPTPHRPLRVDTEDRAKDNLHDIPIERDLAAIREEQDERAGLRWPYSIEDQYT